MVAHMKSKLRSMSYMHNFPLLVFILISVLENVYMDEHICNAKENFSEYYQEKCNLLNQSSISIWHIDKVRFTSVRDWAVLCVLASSCWIVVGVLRIPRICTCIKVCLGRTIALINFTCLVCFSINRGFGVQAVNAFNSLTQSYRNTAGLNLLCAILLLNGLYTRIAVWVIT